MGLLEDVRGIPEPRGYSKGEAELPNLEHFQIGIIEGFFGRPWPWEDRHDYADFLASCGYA